MQVREARYENVVVFELVGAIDQEASPELETRLLALLAKGLSGVVIDLAGVPYVSSAGLRVLMIAAKEYGKGNVRLALVRLSPCVREVFQISRFDKVIRIFEGADEAIGSIAPEALRAFAVRPPA